MLNNHACMGRLKDGWYIVNMRVSVGWRGRLEVAYRYLAATCLSAVSPVIAYNWKVGGIAVLDASQEGDDLLCFFKR